MGKVGEAKMKKIGGSINISIENCLAIYYNFVIGYKLKLLPMFTKSHLFTFT